MNDTAEMLRQYVEQRSEAAFRNLVARYINLVYSTALRQVRDRHLAEDIVQTVFTALAEQAPSLPQGVVLGGWLYRHTSFAAAQLMRTQRRRAAREMRAMETRTISQDTEPDWEKLSPALEEAMNSLAEPERDAIVLRYFDQQDLRCVGQTLGVTEEAARKRVSRGVEKLRAFFAHRGLTLSTGGLGALLTANAVVVAPPELAASVATAAFSTAAASTTISLAILKGLLIMKTKSALIAAIAVAVLGAAAIPLVLSDQPNAAAQNGAVPSQPDKPSQPPTTLAIAPNRPPLAISLEKPMNYPRNTWKFAGYDTPEDAFLTLFWALSSGDIQISIRSLGPRALAEKAAGPKPTGQQLAQDFQHNKGFKVLEKTTLPDNQVLLDIEVDGESAPNIKTLNRATMIHTPDGWKLDQYGPRP